MITSVLVFGLIVAIVLRSVRVALVALVLLLCVIFPALLALVIPAIAGWAYFLIRAAL